MEETAAAKSHQKTSVQDLIGYKMFRIFYNY